MEETKDELELTTSEADANLDSANDADWLVHAPYLHVEFQHGLVPKVGVNGVRVEDVMDVVIRRLERYQNTELACAENHEAIRNLHAAKDAMARRRQRRQTQGVLNTYEPHKGERTEDLVEDFSATGA